MIFSFQRPSHIAISDEKGGVRGISDERGNVRGYREGDDKMRVQLLVDAQARYLSLCNDAMDIKRNSQVQYTQFCKNFID